MIVSRGSSKELTRLQDSKEKKFSPGNGSEMDDWQRAISTPTRYRVGASSINLRPKDVIQICLLLFVVVFVGLVIYTHSAPLGARKVIPLTKPSSYSDKYPLSAPITTANGRKFRIAVITDLDHGSKVDDSLWQSHYLKGFLIAGKDNKFKVEFDSKSTNLYNSLAQGGRGMELSELVVYNEDVITVDDRTGVVYKIVENVVAPWVILSDGPGNVSKGFKSEWATVKDGYLYIGGLGKEWTDSKGNVLNLNPLFVKQVGPDGSVQHLDWHKRYEDMKQAAGITSPGYVIHESGVWSNVHKKWYFLPRRMSSEQYDDKLDERRATNTLIVCDEMFEKITVVKPFGPSSLTHGFSSFKFIPGTNDKYIVALKSEEDDGKTASYIMVLDISGNLIMPEVQLPGNYKYEGVEFI